MLLVAQRKERGVGKERGDRAKDCRVRWILTLCGTVRQCGGRDCLEEQAYRTRGHCEVLMIKWHSGTELYDSIKAKAVSNLKQTAGLT